MLSAVLDGLNCTFFITPLKLCQRPAFIIYTTIVTIMSFSTSIWCSYMFVTLQSFIMLELRYLISAVPQLGRPHEAGNS